MKTAPHPEGIPAPHEEDGGETLLARGQPDALPEVVILGRPNVGKSTLFNRIVRRRAAIVHPEPGVTRDRLTAVTEWRGRRFRLVDTGGITEPMERDAVEAAVWEQVRQALDRAALVLLVVDARAGLVPYDRELALLLRRLGRPALVVANKVDHPQLEGSAWEFAALGLGDPVPVSAAGGRNVGQLLDAVVGVLESRVSAPPEAVEPAAESGAAPPPRVAIVGRPNVGKSSLVNAIAGEPRVAVHPEAGTTRDAVDVELSYGGRQLVLVDTAGIRRAARPGTATVEQLAVGRALSAMRRADVAVLVIDAAEGVTFQDARLAGRASSLGLGVVLAVNKWDRIDPEGRFEPGYSDEVRRAAAHLTWAPVFFISALKGWRIGELLQECLAVADRRRQLLPNDALHAAVLQAQARRPHPARAGRLVRIVRAWQAGTAPPTIALELRGAEELDESYCRYLENQLRRRFDLVGCPLRFAFRPAPRRKPRAD